MSPLKVIICDDDPIQRDSIGVCFTVSGSRYDLTEFELGADMLDYLKTSHADLVCLDLGLPDMDGLDVLRQLRKTSGVPVIVVSGNNSKESVVRALAVGADDYITKPFAPIELMARVGAVTRRTSGRKPQRATFIAPGLTLDFDSRTATVDDKQIELNLGEWELLQSLTQDPGVVVKYSALKKKAWGDATVSDAAVHMAVRRLRNKLNCNSRKVHLIRAHRGIGYSLSAS